MDWELVASLLLLHLFLLWASLRPFFRPRKWEDWGEIGREKLERVARQLGGFVSPDGTHVEIPWRHYLVKLHWSVRGEAQLMAPFDANVRCSVAPNWSRRIFGAEAAFQGVADAGEKSFDSLYLVQGDQQAVEALLKPTVKQRLLELALLNYNNEASLTIDEGQVLISKSLGSEYTPSLLHFTELALQLLEQLDLACYQSRQIGLGLWRSEEGQCPVCGEIVAAEAVVCRSCRTPHHEDCWCYAGRCAIYACGERHFLRRGRKKVSREKV